MNGVLGATGQVDVVIRILSIAGAYNVPRRIDQSACGNKA